MLFFLSKLLPLFIYPVGLLWLLLIGLWFWGWRQRLLLQWLALACVLIISLTGNYWFGSYLLHNLEYRYPPVPLQNTPSAPAIIVLGGGLGLPQFPGQYPEFLNGGDRVLHAAELYRLGKAPLILASGGRVDFGHPWYDSSEAEDMAFWLKRLGISPTAIMTENESLNTYQNAVNTKKILARRGIDSIILVTSAYHMPRSKRIFEKQGLRVIASTTDFYTDKDIVDFRNLSIVNLIFGLIPTVDNVATVSLAMKEYIGFWVYRLLGWL